MAAYAGKRCGPRLGVLGELVELHDGRHEGGAAGDHRVDQPLVEAGAVLDAVDAGLDQPRQHRAPKQCAVTRAPLLVRRRDRGRERLRRERRREVALLAGDPVPHQLDPAVPGARLAGGRVGELAGLDLVGVVADVALGAGQVPPAADQARQVVAVVDPAGVGRRAGVADQQRPGVAVLRPPAPRTPRRRSAPWSSSPMWQWASTSPGTIQPSATVSAPAWGSRVIAPVDDVQVARPRRRGARGRGTAGRWP